MNKIQQYLKSQGYSLVASGYSDTIGQWLHWYQGYFEKFHQYTVTVNSTTRQLKRYTLGMAKTICEDYATLLLNERVLITAKGFGALPGILTDNAFYDRCNRLLELTMALGTGALVEFLSADGKPVIDYIRGDMIFPLSWDGDRITECAFGSRTVYGSGKDAKQGYYIQIHTKSGTGHIVANVALDDAGGVIPLPEGVKPQTGPTQAPLFQILRPNIVNSVDLSNPMGMSVYGACIDQLKACDLVYDSYVNEYMLGKKRLMVPQKLSQILLEEGGTMRPVFDPSDILIYVYQQSEEGTDDIKPLDYTLRAQEHETGLQRMIDLLSKKCGLGAGRYRFDKTGVPAKTATEIISEDDDLYQSVKRHEKPLERALVGMVRALAELSGMDAQTPVTIEFDDSIFEDTGTIIKRNMELVTAGFRSKAAAIMEIDHCDEATAKNRLQEIADEQMLQPETVDTLLSGERA
ncbi:MAG TPA: phage portal protein [Gammaproteobacteria bacterium]|nr:phage portal protein [Gammaproteobacteria bacterium]